MVRYPLWYCDVAVYSTCIIHACCFVWELIIYLVEFSTDQL